MRRFATSFVLALAACAGPPAAAPGDYFPLDAGRTWDYEVTRGGRVVMRIATRAEGGDVRDLPDEERVRFQFTYGRPEDADHDMTKSIYGMASTGPREFYLDAFEWRLYHEPPIPLLPERVAVGRDLAWRGRVEFRRLEEDSGATVRVEAIEDDGTVRVKTTYDALPIEVTRWFRRGVGMVRIEIAGVEPAAGMRLRAGDS